MPPSAPLFALHAVHHTYPGPTPVAALRGIDLTIQPGEYVAIIGANGSGKSTLARHLNALLLPTQGRALTAGLPTHDRRHWDAIRRTVQMVFQNPDLEIVATTIEEDVAFGPENFGVPPAEMRQRVQAALTAVELWALRGRSPHQLSAGQKQRVAIAGALAVQPRALVLDEATAMLDPAGRQAVLAVLAELHAAGTTLVTITHNMEEAALAERVVALHAGRVALDGPPRAVFAQAETLRRLGLDLPPVADLAHRLGLPVCLTPAELLAALGPPPVAGIGDPGPGNADPGLVDPASADPAILIADLRHAYLRGAPLETASLRGVDLRVASGAALGLIGPTGSGKSTLLQHLNGLLRPQSGRVIVHGLDWSDPRLDARAARRQVGLLFQQAEDQLFERFVGDDVAFGPRRMGLDPAAVRRRVQAAMDTVGLPFAQFKDRLSHTLSGGEQRRAALAGVLALEPRLLAADEPTAGLDPRGRADILAIFRRLHHSGVTLVFSSHRLDDVAALCDTVAVLADGRVVAHGPARQVLDRPTAAGQPAHPLAAVAAALRQAGWPLPPGALTAAEIAAAVAAAQVRPTG